MIAKKKYVISVAVVLVLITNTCAYELSTGEIYKDEHYDDIVALEDDIIRDLYNSSLSEPGINSLDHASGIDFEMAQKVYVFSPNDLLSSISCDDFGEVYSDKGQLVWRVPIEISSDTCDYAIIGQGEDGTYSYTTVRTPKENINGVRYLFDPNGVVGEFEDSIGSGILLDVVSVPRYGIDLLILENSTSFSFISLSDVSEQFEFGQTYSKDYVAEQIENILIQDSAPEDAGGGIGFTPNDYNINALLPLTVATFLGVLLCVWQWKKLKNVTD